MKKEICENCGREIGKESLDQRLFPSIIYSIRQFPIKPHRKQKSLMVQDEFGRTVDVGRIELCFLGV